MDGLADWADGFWGARDREKTLAIMKDPRVGSFGALAIACVLLVKWVSLTRLVETGSPCWILAACVNSRTGMVVLLATQPYARAEGGTAAPFSQGAAPWRLAAALLAAAVVTPLFCGRSWTWPAALLLAWAGARVFGAWCNRRVGGITGDLLGACCELTETGILAAGALTGT